MTRLRFAAVLLIAIAASCTAAVAFAQDQRAGGAATSVSSENKTITIKGCLTGIENRYTIGTSRDDLYVLNGDPTLFKRYNGKMVEATGTMSPATNQTSNQDALSQQPPEFKVTKLKKIADMCGN